MQLKNNNLDYMTDLTFRNISMLFVLSFRFGRNMPTRYYFSRYYIPLIEAKGFDVLIDNKLYFDPPVKNKQEAYRKVVEMSRNDDYTIGNVPLVPPK